MSVVFDTNVNIKSVHLVDDIAWISVILKIKGLVVGSLLLL